MLGSIENWMKLLRANFLILTVVTVFAGLAASFYEYHSINFLNAFLCMVGALLAHMAVNVFNNYFDFKMGIDQHTLKTPFSGGVDVIVEGRIKPSTAFYTGVLCLTGAGLVGIYFLKMFFWILFPILLYGGISVYFYTSYLSRFSGLSEIIAGTNYGLISVGAFITQRGLVSPVALAVFVPVSILVGILLFLNEFPDVEVDKMAGRKHLVILLGRRNASRLYVVLLTIMYSSVVFLVVSRILPVTCLLALTTLPFGWKAGKITLKSYDNIEELIPALASNLFVVLFTISLLAVGLFLGVPFEQLVLS